MSSGLVFYSFEQNFFVGFVQVEYEFEMWQTIICNIILFLRDRRFLPQVLFVCTSGKEGGRGLKPWKTENLRKNLRKTCRGGGCLVNLTWGKPWLREVRICERLRESAGDWVHLCKFERISVRFFESVRDYTSFFNLRFNLRKIEGGGGNSHSYYASDVYFIGTIVFIHSRDFHGGLHWQQSGL